MPNGEEPDEPALPVVDNDDAHPAEDRQESEGTALCLSGGGYRAMVFHLGAIIRLNELGKLKGLDRVSSVSGGSITAGVLGRAWDDLRWNDDSVATNLDALVVDPVMRMAGKSIDARSIIAGVLLPGRTVGQGVASAYRKHLYGKDTLQNLPTDDDGPRFVINATNVQTGKLFRFSRPYQGDWTVGLWNDPTTSLADAVTASSAFPPVLSPRTIKPAETLDQATAGPNAGSDFTEKLWLSDGGVYDNLGLETALKRYRTILVAMAAAPSAPNESRSATGPNTASASPRSSTARYVRSGSDQIIDLYKNTFRRGTYWGIKADVEDYGLPDPLDIPARNRDNARGVPTRLKKLDVATRRDLANWGYVIADTPLRTWAHQNAVKPDQLPT